MLKNRVTILLIAGMILFAGTMVMAQSVGERTTVSGTSPRTAIVCTTEPSLFCMNLDVRSPQITRKRLALDPSIQELRWVAAHGPRQDMLEEFLSRQSGNHEVAVDGQMARVGGTIDSWPDIMAGTRTVDYSLVSIDGLNVGLIGPESIRQ